MKYTLTYTILLLIFCSGCENTWDDHYGYEDDARIAGASLTTWETIKTMSDKYPKFITLIKRAGYDKMLNSDRMLTVWMPKDETIPDEVMKYDSLSSEVQRFVKNHMNSLPLFKTKLAGRSQINSLAKKVLFLTEGYSNSFFYQGTWQRPIYIGDNHVYNFDIACTNGVIHEVSGILKPLQNLAEFLMEAGDEYQLFRDSLTGRNDTIFRPELSFPIGVDDVGQTIYDSVFDIEHSLLRGLRLDDEEDIQTLCLPSNDVIHTAFVEKMKYMESIKRPFTAVDSALCWKWIMTASILNGKVENYSAYQQSAYGAKLGDKIQWVDSKYEECSNGHGYSWTKMVLPNYIFRLPVEAWPIYFLDLEKEVNDSLKLWQHTGTFKNFEHKGIDFLQIGGKTGDYLAFKPMRLNIYAEPEIIHLMPGKYAVHGQFYGMIFGNSSATKIYINDEPQNWKEGGTTFPTNNEKFVYNKIHKMIDTVHIKDHLGYHVPTIKIEATSNSTFEIRRIRFEAVNTDDNY